MIKLNIKYKLITINLLFCCILMKAYVADPVKTLILVENSPGSFTKMVENDTTPLTVAKCKTNIIVAIGFFETYTVLHDLISLAIQYFKFQTITRPHVKMYYKEVEAKIKPDLRMLEPYDHCLGVVREELKKTAVKKEPKKTALKKGKDCLLGFVNCAIPYTIVSVKEEEEEEQKQALICLAEIKLYFPNNIEKMEKQYILKYALMNLCKKDFCEKSYVTKYVDHLSKHFDLPGLRLIDDFCEDFIKKNNNNID